MKIRNKYRLAVLLLYLALLTLQARGENECFISVPRLDGTNTSVLLTISIDATSMKIWCSINGGTTALILQSSCGEIKQLSGSDLANNTTFCLTTNLTCSASVTLANNSSMQSTLICYSNNGWVNLNGTIITCMSDEAAKCSVVLSPPPPTTPTTTSHDPTSKTNTTTLDAGSITGITLAVILAAICIFIALLFGMHIKPCHKWMTIIKEGLLKHTENTMQLFRVDLFSASHSNGDEGSRDHPSNMSESSGEQYQTPQQAMNTELEKKEEMATGMYISRDRDDRKRSTQNYRTTDCRDSEDKKDGSSNRYSPLPILVQYGPTEVVISQPT